MAGFSPSDAALEGFRLVRERPGTILAWSGVYALGILLIGLVMVLTLGHDVLKFVKAGGLDEGDIAGLSAALEHAWPALLFILLLVVALFSVITGGVCRLVLRPEERSFVHLRLGLDELRLMGVNLIMVLLGIGYVFCLAVVLAGAAVRPSLAAALAGFGAMFFLIWIGVRLLLAAPMTFGVGRIAIAPSWRLTRGRFWPLFGTAILAFIFYVIVWLLLSVIMWAFVSIAGGQDAIAKPDQLNFISLIAFLVSLFVQLLLPVLQIVTLTAPLAYAYQRIIEAGGETAEAG